MTTSITNANGMAVFLICLLWTFVLFSLLISFLSKNEDFQRAVGAFCRLPPLARAVFVVFISGVIVFGGSKPSALRSYDFTNWFTSGTLDDGPSLSDAQKAAGFALVAAKTNVVFDFNAPTNATVHDVWRKRGAAVDGFLLKPEDGWSFTLGTNTLDSVYVSSSGTIALEERRFTSPKGRMMPDSSGVSFLAPLRTSLGIVPEDNWHLLPNSAQSLFWHDVTQRGSTRFTWQNALPDRATNAPVSFQAELFNSGDFVFRYDIGTNAMPERFVIGAQAYNGGETALVSLPDSACSSNSHVCSTVWHTDGTNITSTPLCEAIGDASRFELRWSAFGEITGDDTDSDGIPDAYEILLYHTDPHLADTDGDGLSDGEEISSGMNPLDPDEDGDGYPDGIDPEEWLANPIWGHSAGATNLVVKLLGSLPDETRCTLSIGSLRLPLEDAQSWSLYLTPGVEYPFALLGAGHPVVRLAAADPSEMQPMAAPTPSGVRSGGDSGAFVLDDPSGVFSGSAVPDARGLMGFATIDLEAGIAPLWGDVCLHGPDPMLNIDLGEAVSPIFAQDKIQWDLGDAFAFTEMAPGVFRLIANSGTISACISPPESLFGFSGPSHISAHRHLGDGDPCVACGYVHKTIEGSATGCIHDKGCAALESIQADCSCAPGFIRVNSDDDDLNGSEDHTQTSVAEGEDDFLMFRIPEPMECYDYCDCSGEDNIYWEVASISPGLRLRLNGEIVTAGKRVPPSSLLAIEARSASAGFGTGQIEFEIHDESKEPEEEVLRRITRRFTAANAQIKPDRNDDGDVDVSDARIAPEWEETVWRVARREDPYLLSLQNECPGGMTPKVYLANDVSHPSVRIGVGDDSATIVPGGSAETGRNMTVNAWLDASGPGTSADLQYGILKSDNSWLYSDELTIEVVDVDLGERWIAAGETASYSFGDWAGNTEWYVLEDGYKIVNYGMGCEFSTSPSLPAGDYIVSADFNDPITGAFGSEGGALHIVDVDIEKDAYGAQCGSDERVKVSLNTTVSTGPADWRIEPFVADGARLYATATGGTGFQTLSGLAEVWVSPGSIPQDYAITATHPFVQTANDTATFTSILLDLDVDSDYDGKIDDLDDSLEESQGGFTATNVMRRVNLNLNDGAYAMPFGEVVLKVVSEGSGRVRLWADAAKRVPIALDDAGEVRWFFIERPSALYVEGVQASSYLRDVELGLEYPGHSSGLELKDSIRLTVIEVKFLEDETTIYNFSPSLGETGSFKVQVSPTPPDGGYTWLAFNLSVVRECDGGAEQFVDWIDVSDSLNSIRRLPLDFGTESFEWDGIRDYGIDLPAASGPETFYGLSSTEHAHRSLPASNVGEPVPPPICTVVARVYNPRTYEILSEARKHVFIPQVARLVYENDAVSLLRTELRAADGTLLYPAITSSQWTSMKTQIKAQVEEFYDQTGANIRIVDSDSGLVQPYTFVRVVHGEYNLDPVYYYSWGVGGGCDFHDLKPNANPSDDMAKVSVWGHRNIIYNCHSNNISIPPLPLSYDNLSWSMAVTACHELGHSLGLVYNNDILRGSDYPYCHNTVVPAGKQCHMRGSSALSHLDPESNWVWTNSNTNYLKFILPKGDE